MPDGNRLSSYTSQSFLICQLFSHNTGALRWQRRIRELRAQWVLEEERLAGSWSSHRGGGDNTRKDETEQRLNGGRLQQPTSRVLLSPVSVTHKSFCSLVFVVIKSSWRLTPAVFTSAIRGQLPVLLQGEGAFPSRQGVSTTSPPQPLSPNTVTHESTHSWDSRGNCKMTQNNCSELTFLQKWKQLHCGAGTLLKGGNLPWVMKGTKAAWGGKRPHLVSTFGSRWPATVHRTI